MHAQFVDAATRARPLAARRSTIPADIAVGLTLLVVALVVGLTTAGDYGFTIDEFNADDYGPKALAWYTSGFTDRSQFETVEEWMWAYGPWAQILVAIAQSLQFADHTTTRHAITFLIGVAGLGALIPLARLTVGGWAGPIAIGLCLTTGTLYGSLFFAPIDIPFMTAMTWALVAILAMARSPMPSWPITIAAGVATGLAIGTRTGGIITHAYLLAAMALAAWTTWRAGGAGRAYFLRIAARVLAVIALAWLTAIALWPWLQIGNPLRQFAIAYVHFATITLPFTFMHWGAPVSTDALPATYVPAQLLARLPEIFLLLLAAAAVIGFARIWHALRWRGVLMLVLAAVLPVAFVIVNRATLYDGVRHLTFILPLLALIAAGALLPLGAAMRARPWLMPLVAAVAAVHVGWSLRVLIALHPLEYVAMNALAGGTAGAYGRFEQDYWSAAATQALHQLGRRLDRDAPPAFATRKPRVIVCIPWREQMAGQMLPARFALETDPHKADFLIGTERWDCGKEIGARKIDAVVRLGTSFAWIYANASGTID